MSVLLVQCYMRTHLCLSFLLSQDKECMLRVTRAVDKANGYMFGDMEERNLQSLMSCAVGAEFEYEKIASVQEKYMTTDTSVTPDMSMTPDTSETPDMSVNLDAAIHMDCDT